MPETSLEVLKRRKRHLVSSTENQISEKSSNCFDPSPVKMKKMTENGGITDDNVANLSEEDQLKWALEQSLIKTPPKDSKSDEIECDMTKLSEEEQLKRVLGDFSSFFFFFHPFFLSSFFFFS